MPAWIVGRGIGRLAVVALLAMATSAHAQVPMVTPGACSALTILAPEPASTPATAAAPIAVVGITSPPFRSPSPILESGATGGWGREITITFQAVDSRLAKCLEGDLTLFLDHHPLTGLAPIERFGNEGKGATIKFRLARPATSTPGWNELMANAWQAGGALDVTVGIGIGVNEFAYSSSKLRLTLGTGNWVQASIALVVSILILVGMWRYSKLLQDRKQGPMSYSISRLILSCWVLTTINAVSLMFLRTGTMPSASDGALVFMLGISGATTGLSALIDLIRKPQNTRATRFWQDFLDDADGLALHRIQVAVFNALVLFIVWRDMIQLGTIAQIDKAWVTLLGASAMTFVFGKSAESTTRMIPTSPPPAPSPSSAAATISRS